VLTLGAHSLQSFFRQAVKTRDCRVTAQRDFIRRSEPSNLQVSRFDRRRKNKRGLGEIDFPRDGLHFCIRKPSCIKDHAGRIAGEGVDGERIHMLYSIGSHGIIVKVETNMTKF